MTFGGSDGRRAIMPGETEAREDWILCDGGSDGKGGTVPDLRGRMILGASDEHTAGSTGGSETHSHSISGTVGSTTLTVRQLARHEHTTTVTSNISGSYHVQPGGGAYYNTGAFPSTNTGDSQPHTHNLTGASEGASSLPPYYVLSFIMRCV